MKTPGGGGYGKPLDDTDNNKKVESKDVKFFERGSVYEYRKAQESV